MKKIIVVLLGLFILICGCSSVQSTVVETTPTSIVPTPVAVTATWIQTVGPTPTPTNDIAECYNHSVTTYPEFCYDILYWVRPTYSPVGAGYSAKVWRNDSCVDLNRTSGECRVWGDGSYVEIFMNNQTIVRNLSGINITEMISAAAYYNRTFDLNVVNGESFDWFISKYWDKTYPGTKYNTSLFVPNPGVEVPVVNESFNSSAW